MNPDRHPQPLRVQRVEWVPSSPDEIEIRVFGAWNGSTVPPAVSLVIGNDVVAPLPDPPAAGLPPAWSSAYLVSVEARAAVEAGNAAIAGPDFALPLPPAEPGAMDPPPGTLVDPAVLAERRARRAELAEESAAARAASAEQTVETLRAQLAHLEERAARATADRDAIAARVADAERRLRLAEQREEAERRRRGELEEEVASARRGAEAEIEDLRARLAAAEELVETFGRELAHAKRQAVDAVRIAEAESAARRAETEGLRAEADALRAEADALRARAAEVDAVRADGEALRAEADALRARAAEADALRAEADSLRLRAAEAAALRDEAQSLRAEADALRARAAQADALRAEADALRVRADAADTFRARAAELERRLATDPGRAETQALRARAAELERRLVAEREAREEAEALRRDVESLEGAADRGRVERLERRAESLERRLAEERAAREAAERRLAVPSWSEDERALVAHVAALERELARRASIQERVQEAIGLIRAELTQVRAQVESAQPGAAAETAAETAALADLRARLLALEDRGRTLEAALRAREAELQAARTELDRARAEAATARAEAERERHALAAAEQSAAEARRIAAELRERLATEHAIRAAAEQRPAASGEEADPAAQHPALDARLAGLRAQVAEARQQLEQWSEPQEPRPEHRPGAGAPAPAEPRSPAGGQPALHERSSVRHEPPPLDAPLPPKRAEQRPAEARPADPPAARAPEAVEDDTRRRLQAIAAELRAAVPEQPGSTSRDDVIASLQQAAERLRAAAEQELERLEQPGAAVSAGCDGPPAPDAPLPAEGRGRVFGGADFGRDGAAAAERTAARALAWAEAGNAPVEDLGPRRIAPPAGEAAWLRTGLERLAAGDPETAARLLAALLPVQALVVDDLAYDLTAPVAGTLRVVLQGGLARIEPRDAPGPRDQVDVLVEGPLEALAPLAAGGAPRRLRGVTIAGRRRRLRRLAKARRSPVGLTDLGRAGSPVHPGLLLSALAAAVEPAWTRGHRFTVAYAVGGDGTFTVNAADGMPLTVRPGAPDDPGAVAATVVVAAPAFMPLVAGQAPPPGERAAVVGDRRAVDVLHAWFDTARGVGAQ